MTKDNMAALSARFVDMKVQSASIKTSMDEISEQFKRLPESELLRNEPYLMNYEGRSIVIKVEKRTRRTLDTKKAQEALTKCGVDVEGLKTAQDVQTFTAYENRLFDYIVSSINFEPKSNTPNLDGGKK